MQFKKKKIILVGGAGFIGHNLAISLRMKGADVKVLDSLQVNNLGEHSNSRIGKENPIYIDFLNERVSLLQKNKIPLDIVDARDYHLLSNKLSDFKPDIVVFLAAVAHANKANKDPYNTFDHSLRTLENTLDTIRDTNAHLIYFSSSMVYGEFEERKVSELTVCNPIGIYGALKYSGEKLLIAYNQVFGLKYSIIRPSALYGERCVSRRVSQVFIENAINSKNLEINGDGQDSLDFTYIDDLINGVELVIKNKSSLGQTFNITFGKSEKIINLAKYIANKFNVKINFKKRDKLMPKRGTLDISKAKKLINYSPIFNIYKGIDKYIDWYKHYLK
ncbi:MAG: nucleoside-diphosphate sugar epimerase [Rickettsiales bacterium]|nr:nucleoside-diphosphate sugar epimerase [Rickettsiales bacterium]|tara:strand:- start:1976 stop:2974 length:999 start_codon:yes stop_codon:yes gene_type:complete